MKLLHLFLSLTLGLAVYALGALPAYALENQLPVFPSCPNPGGTVVASYDDGWHWIVGNETLQWGSDKVFNIGDGRYVQCFCPKPQGENQTVSPYGIQTNWLPVSSITSELKDRLLGMGWYLVENGADFGLSAEPYLAKNKSFLCSGIGGICVSDITQSNTAVVSNTVVTNTNTGGNSVSGNTGGSTTVVTGDTSSTTTVENRLNLNSADTPACNSCGGSASIIIEGNGAGSYNRVSVNSITPADLLPVDLMTHRLSSLH